MGSGRLLLIGIDRIAVGVGNRNSGTDAGGCDCAATGAAGEAIALGAHSW